MYDEGIDGSIDVGVKLAAEVHTQAAKELGEKGMRDFWNLLYHSHTRGVENLDNPDARHDGHVANVVRVSRLVVEMALANEEDDFLRIFGTAEQFKPEGMTQARCREVTAQVFVTAAAGHDLANVVSEVDWGKKTWKTLEKIVVTGAEEKSAQMYRSQVDGMKARYGWSDAEAEFAKKLGGEWILGTEFDPNLKNKGLHQLELVDQLAGIFSPNGLEGVVGLVAENEDRVRNRDIGFEKFNPGGFFGGFVRGRFEVSQEEFGVGMDEFTDKITRYSLGNWEKFSKIMGFDSNDYELRNYIQKEGWKGFVEQKLAWQKRIGVEIFGEGELSFSEAMDKVGANLDRVREACDEYRENFWKV